MFILGISSYYHDSAACLLKDGEIVAAAQEERFSRIKHDQDFPTLAIKYCLSHERITPSNLEAVVFYDKPLLKFERLLETYIDYAPAGLRSFLMAMPVWLRQKLWIREDVKKKVGFDGPVLFTEHHESHAASAFFPSPFDRAAVLTMDGVGEWATSSFGYGSGNKLRLLSELHFPHSLGLLYSAFTYYTGFKVNSAEYKVMGLAPYGEPKFVTKILDELIDLRDDGSLRMNMEYFNFAHGLTMTNDRFDALFEGNPRKPESEITQRDMDLARSVQEVTETVMLRMARHVHRETGERNLCMAGGVALNCVGNGRLLREGPFENIWIQPAAGDAGGAVGAALSVWHQYLDQPRVFDETTRDGDRMKGSYLGPSFSSEEIRTLLSSIDVVFDELDAEGIVRNVSQLLSAGKVVGWVQGRMEFGPRALGARSILGNPLLAETQSLINLKIKFRESFRPFAPSVLRENVSEFFELEDESPYMLLVAPVREDLRLDSVGDVLFGLEKLKVIRSRIPAVTHVDFSARVQTVTRDTGPLYYDLIAAFGELTGYPLLVNTSFNIRGEPIVCTPAEAFACFLKTGMDCLVLGNYLIRKDRISEGDLIRLRENYSQIKTHDRTEAVTPKQARKTAAAVGAILAIIGAWQTYRERLLLAGLMVGIAVGLLLIAAFLPRIAVRFHQFWMKLAHVLGFINSRVLLSVVFFFLIVPYRIILRIAGRDRLNRRCAARESYWIKRTSTRQTKDGFERLF